MMALGNVRLNSIYCAKTDVKDLVPLNPNSAKDVRKTWIHAKYAKKSFVDFDWKGDGELGEEVLLLPKSGECVHIWQIGRAHV